MSAATRPTSFLSAMPGIQTPIPAPPWFRLNRHDDPEDPSDPAEDPADDPEGDPQGDPAPDPADDPADPSDDDPEPEGLGDAGKRALERMKAERAQAKKDAAEAKKAAAEERRKAAALAKKVEEFEDRDRDELERAKAKTERAEKQAAKAVARAVAAEVKASATGRFADLTDATDALMQEPAKYVDADGDIDTDAIEADLADLLERKPHWAAKRKDPAGSEDDPQDPPAAKKNPARPKPDPGQGSRGPAPKVDFRTAPKDVVDAELKKLGIRPR